MDRVVTVYSVADRAEAAPVRAALEASTGLRCERLPARAQTWYDTFDRRLHQAPIFESARRSAPARAYRALMGELADRTGPVG